MSENFTTIDLYKILNDLESARSKATKYRNNLLEKYSWDKPSDTRVGVFEQIGNLLLSLNLSITFLIRGYNDLDWLSSYLFGSLELSQNEKEKQLRAVQLNLYNFQRISFIYALMQVVEGSIRSVAREVIPDEDATGSFGIVCKNLNSQLTHSKMITQDMRTALDLLRVIRNTIHNNGYYYPDNDVKREKVILYRGREYKFEYGKPHSHATYSVLTDIILDILSFFRTLFEDPEVANIEYIKGTSNNVFNRIGA